MNKFRRKKTGIAEQPNSVEGIKIAFLLKIINLLKRQSPPVQIFFCIVLIVILFIVARFGLLGLKPYEFTHRIVPIHIPIIDVYAPVIPLSLNYEIEDASGNRRTGKIDDQCCTGDRITLSFKAGCDCNALIIGVDAKKTYSIFGEEFKAQRIIRNESYTVNTFSLDSTTGTEAYYLIASAEQLDFEEYVEPEIKRIKSISGKGVVFSTFELKLQSGIYYKYVNFKHKNCSDP